MKEIYDYLSSIKNLQLSTIDNDHGEIDNIYANLADEIYYSITGPHSGNGYTYLVRADAAATHDRWSNCDWEYNFETEEQVMAFFKLDGLARISEYTLSTVEWKTDMASYIADFITNKTRMYWEERAHETGNN